MQDIVNYKMLCYFYVLAIFKVYCADHTYTTLKLPMEASVSRIVRYCAHKLGLGNDLVLCEVRSNGGKICFIVNLH